MAHLENVSIVAILHWHHNERSARPAVHLLLFQLRIIAHSRFATRLHHADFGYALITFWSRSVRCWENGNH